MVGTANIVIYDTHNANCVAAGVAQLVRASRSQVRVLPPAQGQDENSKKDRIWNETVREHGTAHCGVVGTIFPATPFCC